MQKKLLTAVVAMSVMMAGALPAFADDHEPVKYYDEDQHILMFAVDGECMLEAEMDIVFTVVDDAISFEVVVEDEEVVVEETVEPVVVDEDATDPMEGCYPFSVEGPNGQVNHGTFVSNLMHALKEMGIKGSDKKEFKSALKEYGKGDMQVKVKDVDEESTLTVKPAKAEKTNKGLAKKAEKANKGQNK